MGRIMQENNSILRRETHKTVNSSKGLHPTRPMTILLAFISKATPSELQLALYFELFSYHTRTRYVRLLD